MKKIYLTPEMEVVKMQTMTVLAASDDPIDTVDNDEKVTPGTEEAPSIFDLGGEDW